MIVGVANDYCRRVLSDLLPPVGALPASMEWSGSDVASCLNEDLALSEDDDPPVVDHWPELPPPSFPPQHGKQLSLSSSSTKRPAEDSPDSVTEDCLLPVAKTAKSVSTARDVSVSRSSLPLTGASPSAPSRPHPNLPAFAPRDTYVKLSFTGSPSTGTKLRWLSAVNKAFQLQRDLAEIKMAAITSRFVYISRQRTDILERVKSGEFLSLPLIPHDSPERPRKYPSYILTRFPVDVDPRLAEGHPGVYSARRFVQDGSPINRIVVVWSLPDPPPSTIAFDFSSLSSSV